MSNYSDNRMTRFLTGKSFYLVLGLCLAAAGTAAYLAVGSALGEPEPQPLDQPLPQLQEWGFPQYEEAGRSQSGVAVSSSQPPVSSVAPQSSYSQPESAAADSRQSAVPKPSPNSQFVLPLSGEIITAYSNGELIKSETLGDWRTHNGLDLAAEEGTPVAAAAEGTVTSVRSDPLWGFVVEIDHSGEVTSIYCGLSKETAVKQGDAVKAGQIIGTVGAIPAESLMPSHLHFELKQQGKWIDPQQMIG